MCQLLSVGALLCAMLAATNAAPTAVTEKTPAVQYEVSIQLVIMWVCPRFCNPAHPHYFQPTTCATAKNSLFCIYCRYSYQCGKTVPKTDLVG